MGDLDDKMKLRELLDAVRAKMGVALPAEMPTTLDGLLALLRSTRTQLDMVITEIEKRGTDHRCDPCSRR